VSVKSVPLVGLVKLVLLVKKVNLSLILTN
jgi:hypothetical protein